MSGLYGDDSADFVDLSVAGDLTISSIPTGSYMQVDQDGVVNGMLNLTPGLNDTYDLGSSLLKWRNLFVSTLITLTGATIVGSLIPNALTYDIGSALSSWRDAYFSGTITASTLVVSTVTIATLSLGTLTMTAALNQIRIRPGGTGNSLYLTATNPAADRTLTLRDPGGNADITYSTDFDQLAQLRTNGNPTFDALTVTSLAVNSGAITILRLMLQATGDQIRLRPGGGANHSLYLTCGSPAGADRRLTLRDPGADTDITYASDFDQLTQLRTTGVPTFAALRVADSTFGLSVPFANNVQLTFSSSGYIRFDRSINDMKLRAAQITMDASEVYLNNSTWEPTNTAGVTLGSGAKRFYYIYCTVLDCLANMRANSITSDTGLYNGIDVPGWKGDYDNKINQDVRTSASPTFTALTAGASTLASANISGTLSAGASTLASANISGTLSAGASTLAGTTVSSLTCSGTLSAGASTLTSANISGTLSFITASSGIMLPGASPTQTIFNNNAYEATVLTIISGITGTSGNFTCYLSRCGHCVTFTFPTMQGTSNAGNFITSALPEGYRPPIQHYHITIGQNNGVNIDVGALVNTGGTIQWFQSPSGVNFTAGTCGPLAGSFSWTV